LSIVVNVNKYKCERILRLDGGLRCLRIAVGSWRLTKHEAKLMVKGNQTLVAMDSYLARTPDMKVKIL
jgi:hypothetical protein